MQLLVMINFLIKSMFISNFLTFLKRLLFFPDFVTFLVFPDFVATLLNLSNQQDISLEIFHWVRPDFNLILSKFFCKITLHYLPTCNFAGLIVLHFMVQVLQVKFMVFQSDKGFICNILWDLSIKFLGARIRAASSFIWFNSVIIS